VSVKANWRLLCIMENWRISQ